MKITYVTDISQIHVEESQPIGTAQKATQPNAIQPPELLIFTAVSQPTMLHQTLQSWETKTWDLVETRIYFIFTTYIKLTRQTNGSCEKHVW